MTGKVKARGNRGVGILLVRSFVDFFKDEGVLLSGALSFFTMTAIVPFCLILVTILGYLLGENQELLRFLTSKLVSFFPRITHEITDELRKLISFRGLGTFSLLLYAVLSYELFSTIERAMNLIFKTKAKRHFLLSFLLSIVFITLIIASLMISFGLSSAIPAIRGVQEFVPGLQIGVVTGFFVGVVIPFVLIFMIVTSMYTLLPKKRVRLANAATGALFTTLMIEPAKHAFTFYVLKVSKLGTIYGPLSAIVIFLLWIYYSSCILLIGAEIVHNLDTSRTGR
ncbi:MAG: YihY/virulence factor BrkB family protein [Nitrospirales bacterium]|nr:YihY/virulence factor BrkB family protein [Nitrospirales bacterium]